MAFLGIDANQVIHVLLFNCCKECYVILESLLYLMMSVLIEMDQPCEHILAYLVLKQIVEFAFLRIVSSLLNLVVHQ